MANAKRASMREGPLAALFRKTEGSEEEPDAPKATASAAVPAAPEAERSTELAAVGAAVGAAVAGGSASAAEVTAGQAVTGGGDATLVATSSSTSTAKAEPVGAGSTSTGSLGFGASVALNLVTDTTTASLIGVLIILSLMVHYRSDIHDVGLRTQVLLKESELRGLIAHALSLSTSARVRIGSRIRALISMFDGMGSNRSIRSLSQR